jgi:hypothetical protein
MRIKVKDDNQNWLNWGNLVQTWIDDEESRPTSVGELRDQLAAKGIDADCLGENDRPVQIYCYPDALSDALVLVIPTAQMRDAKLGTVQPGPYNTNMPLFYDIAYAGAPRAYLSAQEARDFAIRRIGEYTVNECC